MPAVAPAAAMNACMASLRLAKGMAPALDLSGHERAPPLGGPWLAVAMRPPGPGENASTPICDQYGNDHDKAFQAKKSTRTMAFDRFEAPFSPSYPPASAAP